MIYYQREAKMCYAKAYSWEGENGRITVQSSRRLSKFLWMVISGSFINVVQSVDIKH